MYYRKGIVCVIIGLFTMVATDSFGQQLADSEIKKNVSRIDRPIDKLLQLQPMSFEYDVQRHRHLKLQSGQQYGFMAENLQTVFPQLVKERSVSYMFGKNAYRSARIKVIDEASLIPVMVACIKEQQAMIEQLRSELDELKKR